MRVSKTVIGRLAGPGRASAALSKRCAILLGQRPNPLAGVLELCRVRATQLTDAAEIFNRAGRRNPGLVSQLRLSWAMVYFGSPTFLGFVMTAACSHWLDSGQRGGTRAPRLAPPRRVTCSLNSRKYVVKAMKTENMKSTHLLVIK